MFPRFPFAHTFSIAARDPATGQLGVAVQSHWFSVGGTVAWVEAGVGAVATQAFAEVSYGPLGLERLRLGENPVSALSALLAADAHAEVRQVGMVDAQGRTAAHTGSKCMADAGHIQGEGFTVQANMMINPRVWPAMAAAYTQSQGDLTERLLAALEAAQSAGGDIRGRQSAAILVVSGTPGGKLWEDRLFDLRVEDHPDPIQELRRLVTIQRAYQEMNLGDAHLAAGKIEQALTAYQNAERLAPSIIEIQFWNAVTLADLGKFDQAFSQFKRVFTLEPVWWEVLLRLPPTGMVKNDPDWIHKLLASGRATHPLPVEPKHTTNLENHAS